MCRPYVLVSSLLLCVGLAACSVMPNKSFPREHHVNLHRFMGAWYVIAHIPPGKTAHAYDAIERYRRVEPDRIHVRFTYRDGSFKARLNTMEPTANVVNGSGNAVWAMQFFWPLKLQYVISYVSPDYQTTIIARQKRDYVWIMARTPKIPQATYQQLVQRVSHLGYDVSKLRKVPQQPLAQRNDR